MRRRKRSGRGEGQMGCIFGLVLMAIGIFIAWKLVPIKVRAAELRQEVLDQSKAGGMRSDDRIMAAILRKAEDDNLPVTADNVLLTVCRMSLLLLMISAVFEAVSFAWDSV